MNPVVFQIANGNVFFIGIGITVAAFALRLWLNNRSAIVLLTLTWLLGMSLVVISATPIPIWLYGIWFGLCILTRIAFFIQTSAKSKSLTTVIFAMVSTIVCFVELPFHLARPIPLLKDQTIYVIGDSISAGIDTREKTWPYVLGDLSGEKVVNLAQAGATLDTAMYQIPGITSSNALVLVEIGGNDLLGSTDSRTFYVQLDKLLAKIKVQSPQIVMFELPLLPFWNNFGSDQRILAKKYGASLIPKSYMVRVFAQKEDTIDGLHLSQKGHNELAAAVYALMKIKP
jgi:acyl-CoA thioesterase I